MTLPDPNVQNQVQPGNDQTDYKAEYVKLSAQIANGDYVPKNVYTGLQQTHEKTILAHKADKDALSAVQQKAQGLEATLQTLQAQSQEFQTKLQSTEATNATLQSEVERKKLIMGKFPQLAPFEADGLLPVAPLDQLETLLATFNSKLGATQTAAKTEHIAGASNPPPGNSQAEPTSKQLLDKANVLAREGKWAEYNTVYDQYLQSLPK